MIINDGNNDYQLNEFHINYVQLQGSRLSFRLKDDTLTSIDFNSQATLTSAIDVFVKRMHQKLATIGAVKGGYGILYWINTKNVLTHSRSEYDIDIAFNNNVVLTLKLPNETEAVNHYEYFAFRWRCNHLDEVFSGRKILKVNPNYTTDASKRKFRTYTEAAAAAVSGDVIWVENTTIELTTERYDLKDGVDIYFEDTIVTVTEKLPYNRRGGAAMSNKPLFCDLAGNLTVNIYGSLTFDMATDAAGWMLIDIFYPDTVINFQFYKATRSVNESNSSSHFHSFNGKLRITGYLSELSRAWDDDGNVYIDGDPQIFDSDVLISHNRIAHYASDVKLFFPYDLANMHYYLRNGYYEGNINIPNSEDTSYNFLNAKFKVPTLILGSLSIEAIRIWRSIFEIEGNNPPFIDVTSEDPPNEIESFLKSIHDYSGGLGMPESFKPGEQSEYIPGLEVSEGELLEDLGEVQPLYGELSYMKNEMSISMPNIPKAKFIELHRDDVLYKTFPVTAYDDFFFTIPLDTDAHSYKVRAYDGTNYSDFSNQINYNMAKINVTKSKFATGDTIFYMKNNRIVEAVVTKLMPEVSNPADDAEGVQINKYLVTGQALPLLETEMYFSKNALLSHVKGEYFLPHGVLLDDLLGGANGGNDFGGFTFEQADLSSHALHFENSFVENCNFTNAVLGIAMDTKAEFRAYVAAYDPVTTIWTDGNPIGDA